MTGIYNTSKSYIKAGTKSARKNKMYISKMKNAILSIIKDGSKYVGSKAVESGTHSVIDYFDEILGWI